jgi:hypothetical protein
LTRGFYLFLYLFLLVSTNSNFTTQGGIPDISKDEHFQVWMRTAGLPNFRKLYAQSFTNLAPGNYTIDVLYRTPTQ